jgi:hypothetical protein
MFWYWKQHNKLLLKKSSSIKMKNLFKNIYLFVLLSLWGLSGCYAQLYPVQLTPVFNSPYSVKISDYATSMDTKMQLLINPTDISINNRQVRLKLFIQGNGINAQSSAYIQGQNPIFINGGELQTLTNVDIAALFRLENLEGITAVQYANPLPEGMYNFCFEMYDFITNQKISQKSCSMLYLILNDPPLLNTPQRNEQIAASDFPNILFTWTPRQINATNVSYTYELKELLDPSLDPQYGFQMAPLLYQETDLHSTAMVYDLGKPNLVPGKRYAWRVKTVSTSGLSENSVFKNGGYSEIFSFKYTGYCQAPTFLLSEAQGPKSVKITWQGVPEHTRYQLQYKKQDVANAQWFSVYSQNTQSLLTDLEAGVTYQFRVGSSCDPVTEGRQSFTYSGINTFTTPTQTNGVSAYNCGITPKISIQNQKPIDNLIQSETFTAGDFPVTILELSGHNPYSGKGYIIVPYLADTKIAVEFSNITINTDYQLINGLVETSYNPDWKNITDLEDYTGEGKGGQIEEVVPFVISNITIDANKDIVVNGPNGEQITIPGGKDTVIIGKDGTVYNVDSEGNVGSAIAAAPGGKSTPENTDGVDATGQATAFTAKGISIQFTGNGSKYAFDTMPENAPKDIQKLYAKVGSTPLPYKAVVNRESDTLLATVTITDNTVKPEDIVFKTQNGALVQAIRNDKTFVLTVKGNQTYAEEQVLATIKQGDRWKVIGAFMLVHISPKEVNVVLVKLNNASIPLNATTDIENIYKTAGVKFTISPTVINLEYNHPNKAAITVGDSDFFATYTGDEQLINSKLSSLPSYKNNTYYLIYSDLPPSKVDVKGFMALKGQYGYVFPKAPFNTGAHELGHGALGLEHPFKTEAEQGKTNFLMDYGDANASILWHNDWKQINDPKFRLYLFQGDSEGELNKFAHLALTPSGIVIDEFYLDNTRIVVRVVVAKNYVIKTIKYNDKDYEWNSTTKAFINGTEKIITKKVSKTINNKVNLFRYRGDGCTYDYVLIDWNTEDEKVSDVNSRVQEKLKSFTDLDWRPSPLDIKDASCSNNFAQELLTRDQKACSSSEIQDGVAELKGVMKLTDGEKVATSVNNACMSAIRNLTYTEIETLIKIVVTQIDIKEHSELAILRLMSAIKTDSYSNYYAFLEKDTNKVLKKLIAEMDDSSIYFLTDKKNYTNFIGALVTMFNQSPKSIESRWPKQDDDYAKRIINLNAIEYDSDFASSIWLQAYSTKRNTFEYNDQTSNITIYDFYATKNFTAGGTGTITNKDIVDEISPLTPIILVPEDGKLPLIATALGDNSLGNNYYIVPSIFLKYQKDKNRNDYIEKGVITTLDLATIYLSGGTALAAKVTWVRRAWAMAEVAGAVGNIAVNMETLDPKSNLGKAINAYNIGMGVIGVKNIAVGGYKFVSSLPATTKALLKESKGLRDLINAQYLNWNSLVMKYKSPEAYISAEVRNTIEQQGNVFGQLSGKVLRRFNSPDEIAQYLKTDKNGAFFWSGRTSKGEGVVDKALEIAQNRGANTLEGTLAKYNIEMPIWDAKNPASIKAWEDVSGLYATQVSGEVRAVLGKSLRPGNIWETIELPRLKQNPDVTKIIVVDAETLIETVVWVQVIRKNWNGVANIFRATAEEIKEATDKIKNYRLTISSGGNYGYLEGTINNKIVENKFWRSGKFEAGEPQIFAAIAVEGSNGGTWLRNTDSEYKMLNKLAEDLGAKVAGKYPAIKGELKIISENPYCASCTGIIQQFNEMFPNVKLILIDGTK